ncbi:glycosyltransferase [Holdemanella biformis]|uniref:Glycosyltransferase family 4 protein n=1 Tax=Holdemanella biformis TaxID=1735 RepID=A0A413UD80_9FIRM|nr:glycosyltransferase [Holdemanella biformis]RHB07216.1 glycosyltransferase family 4 protein [Holdemanella biformis]
MNQTKKISFFIGGMMRGGAERVISILANHYVDHGWDVDIVLLLYDREAEYELNKNIKIVKIVEKGNYIKAAPKWLYRIRKYLKRRKPDRIVSFIGRINIIVLTAKLGLKIKTIISERNDPKHDGRGILITKYGNLIYRTADRIVYQTKYEKSCFPKYLDKKGCIIVNPVTVKAEAHDTDYHSIVTAGRLLPQKNQKLLIEAVAKLKDKYSDIKLTIYGNGTLKDELLQRAEELGVQDNVSLPGNVIDIHERISTAGLFVMTSEFEGLSNALIEAMMIGLPCITTDYPGAEEVIENGVNGLVVQRGNVNELVDAIRKIFEDDSLKENIINNSIRESVKYRKHAVLKEWEQVIS